MPQPAGRNNSIKIMPDSDKEKLLATVQDIMAKFDQYRKLHHTLVAYHQKTITRQSQVIKTLLAKLRNRS